MQMLHVQVKSTTCGMNRIRILYLKRLYVILVSLCIPPCDYERDYESPERGRIRYVRVPSRWRPTLCFDLYSILFCFAFPRQCRGYSLLRFTNAEKKGAVVEKADISELTEKDAGIVLAMTKMILLPKMRLVLDAPWRHQRRRKEKRLRSPPFHRQEAFSPSFSR